MVNILNAHDEVEDDIAVSFEAVTRKKSIMASKTLHNFWMLFENTTP